MSAASQTTPERNQEFNHDHFGNMFVDFLSALHKSQEVRTAFRVEERKRRFTKEAFKAGFGGLDNSFSGWLTGNGAPNDKHMWCKWFRALLLGEEDNLWNQTKDTYSINRGEFTNSHEAITQFLNSEPSLRINLLSLVDAYLESLEEESIEKLKPNRHRETSEKDTASNSLRYYPNIRIERDNIRNSSTTFASLYLDTAQGGNGAEENMHSETILADLTLSPSALNCIDNQAISREVQIRKVTLCLKKDDLAVASERGFHIEFPQPPLESGAGDASVLNGYVVHRVEDDEAKEQIVGRRFGLANNPQWEFGGKKYRLLRSDKDIKNVDLGELEIRIKNELTNTSTDIEFLLVVDLRDISLPIDNAQPDSAMDNAKLDAFESVLLKKSLVEGGIDADGRSAVMARDVLRVMRNEN